MSRIEERINRELREQLTTINTKAIGKGELKTIVRNLANGFKTYEQYPEKSFYSNFAPHSVPADARVDFVYTPTYLACATMMVAIYRYPEWLKIKKIGNALHDGLTACTGRGFQGAGYDDTTGFLDAMDILAQGQVMNFIERFPDFNPTFNNAVFNAVAHLEKEICSGAVVDPWNGKNYVEKGERILPRLKALKDDETLLFVYGTLMSGQSAHEILNESTYRGKYVLKDYAMFDLGSFPAIKSKTGETVIGEVYVISKDLIPDLDRYEGEGSLYSRQQVEVTSDKEKITVYAYVYLGSVESAPTKHEMWGINNEDIVWYACYGSNLSEERFLYYLEGGTCPLNGKTYRGCDDASYWKETAYAKVRGEMYFGNSSPSWNHKGVAFFDPNTEGTTYMKLYSIKRSQLLGVQRQEGLSDNWYGRILCLGIRDDRPIYTFTSRTRRTVNLPDEKYLTLIATELKRCFALTDEEVIGYIMGLILRSTRPQ